MERRFYITFLLFVICLGGWFYLSLNVGINWSHPWTHDAETGARLEPQDVDRYASKVLRYTKEYVANTSSEDRLHDRIAFINLETLIYIDHTYADREDLIRSGWPVSNQKLCGDQLNWLLSQLQVNRNYSFVKGELGEQLTDLMDSYGKPEAGFYHSAINHWVGAYDQCLGVHFKREQIKARYCTVNMRPKWWPENENIFPRPFVRVGICLPETCDTMSLDAGHKEAIEKLTKYELNNFYREGYDVVSMYCLPDERSPLRQLNASSYAFMTIFGIWFALVIAATIVYEIRFREKKSTLLSRRLRATNGVTSEQLGTQLMIESNLAQEQESLLKKLCKSLSLRRSLNTFKTRAFAIDYSKGQRVRLDLGCLDFIKCVMTLLVVMGHCGWLLINLNRSPGHKIELSRHKLSLWVVSITLFVDTFFIMFGILFSYNLMRKLKRQQLGDPLVWLGVICRIFIRVTPIYLFIQWYNQSISPYTQSGPLWDYGTGARSLKHMCLKEPWWNKVPIFSALRAQPWSDCLPPAWFLVSYLQIGFFVPPLTYILVKLPNNLWRLLLTASTVMMSLMYLTVQLHFSTTIPLTTFLTYGSLFVNLTEKFEVSGAFNAMSRFGAVSVGCFVGCLLRLYEEGIIDRWPKWLRRRSALFIASGVILYILATPVLLYLLYNYADLELSKMQIIVLINQLRPITWYTCNAIILIILSTTLNHTVVSRFCAHNFWHSFNKLGLNIYLLHWEVLFVLMTSWDRAAPYGLVNESFRYGFATIIYSTLIGGFLYLFIEVPAGNLMTRLDEYLAKPRVSNKLAGQGTR